MDTTSTPPPSPAERWWALYVSGDVDLAARRGLDARIGRAMARRHDDGLVLDLSAVTFMDCAGLGPVMRGRNRLGNRLCLRAVPERVLRLIELTGVADILRLLPEGALWPAEADHRRCGIVLDDLFDHRPARPQVRLPGPDAALITSAVVA